MMLEIIYLQNEPKPEPELSHKWLGLFAALILIIEY